jgi:hypothetical protein
MHIISFLLNKPPRGQEKSHCVPAAWPQKQSVEREL